MGEEDKQSTMAQLQVLMKQKEAQAIRRLVQEKDEESRGAGREKDLARQKRKAADRSASEVKAIEQQRLEQNARKRADQVVKREGVLLKRNRYIAEQAREHNEKTRMEEVRKMEARE